ncbi:MAG TPA: glycoside hydrolase [Clostridia bacterium]|nr:glycoside hydrolase [Clostridia bacterium]
MFAQPPLFQIDFENNWYYVPDPPGIEDLWIHARMIDYIIPFWFGVTQDGGLADQSDPEALEIIRRFNLRVLAIIHNYSSPQFGPLIHQLLTTAGLRERLVANILMMMQSRRFAGVNIDFEFVPPEDRPFLTLFMTELYTALHPFGFLVTISVPAELEDNPRHPFSGAFSYPDLSRISDQMYILAYDEHFAEPGPIASIGFVRQVLTYALSVIPLAKIRLGMAVYGYDWSQGARVPETLSYAQAITRAERTGAVIRYDEVAQESTYNYVEGGISHVVWFEDARSFGAKLTLVRQLGIPGIGVWRLGLEDPRVWDLLAGLASSPGLG